MSIVISCQACGITIHDYMQLDIVPSKEDLNRIVRSYSGYPLCDSCFKDVQEAVKNAALNKMRDIGVKVDERKNKLNAEEDDR